MTRLFRKIPTFVLQALRCFPFAAALDNHRYDRIEKLLYELPAECAPRNASRHVLDTQLIRQALSTRSHYRLVNPGHLNDNDRLWLSNQGLNADFIARNRANPANANSLHANERVMAGPPSKSADFQLEALESRKISAICPISGKQLFSTKSILAAEGQPIFYRFDNLEVFYLAVGRVGFAYTKLYLYFPNKEAIILLVDESAWNSRDEVDQFRSYMISHWTDVLTYLTNQQPPESCALIDCNHFAHHLWNTLTGIDKLITSGHALYLDKVIVAAEPFGPIDQIFPQLHRTTVERHEYPTLLRNSLRQNWFLIRPGDTIISERVIAALRNFAQNTCSPPTVSEARRLRAEHWPILWMTIRTHDRTWISQCHGIASIANSLAKEFPSLALIIDGFCVPYGRPHIVRAQQEHIIRQELKCAHEIREHLSGAITVHVNISRPLLESILFASITDCYLVHHGSLQHKIGWIANCPGVVHSNRHTLQHPKGKHKAMRSREDCLLPSYIAPESIFDINNSIRNNTKRRWADSLANYDFDQRVALADLRRILYRLSREKDTLYGKLAAYRYSKPKSKGD